MRHRSTSCSALFLSILVLASGLSVAGPRARKVTEGREPAVSPDGTRIAFSRVVDGNRDIWLCDLDGGAMRRVTHDPASDAAPAWSPDGRTLVFVSNRDGGARLHVVDLEGSQPPARVTRLAGSESDPAWSPDGARIAFTFRDGGPPRIGVVSPDGQPLAFLEVSWQGGVADPSWSPEGDRVIAVTRKDADEDLVILSIPDLHRSEPRLLLVGEHDERDPAWHPSRDLLVFTTDRDLWSAPELFGQDGEHDRARGAADTAGRDEFALGVDLEKPRRFVMVARPDRKPRLKPLPLRGRLVSGPSWTPDGRSVVLVQSTVRKKVSVDEIWIVEDVEKNAGRG